VFSFLLFLKKPSQYLEKYQEDYFLIILIYQTPVLSASFAALNPRNPRTDKIIVEISGVIVPDFNKTATIRNRKPDNVVFQFVIKNVQRFFMIFVFT
jgi:hypothetical protein